MNNKLLKIKLSPIVELSQKVNNYNNNPENTEKIIAAQRGELNFEAASKINWAITQSIQKSKNKYPVPQGELLSREAICRKLLLENNFAASPDDVVLTYGGQEALQLAFSVFEGQTVATFSPTWPLILENFVPYLNLSLREIFLTQKNSAWEIDWEEAENVIASSKALYLNNPNNPCGKIYSREDLLNIVKLCKFYNVTIISDEAYERTISDNHISVADICEELCYHNIISCFTLSKRFACTGYRIGFLVTPIEIKNRKLSNVLSNLQYTQTAGVSSDHQATFLEAYSDDGLNIKYINGKLLERKKKLDTCLKENSYSFLEDSGSFYYFINFRYLLGRNIPISNTNTQEDLESRSRDINNFLLEKKLATIPGICFSETPLYYSYARISYSALNSNDIDKICSILKEIKP